MIRNQGLMTCFEQVKWRFNKIQAQAHTTGLHSPVLDGGSSTSDAVHNGGESYRVASEPSVGMDIIRISSNTTGPVAVPVPVCFRQHSATHVTYKLRKSQAPSA